MRWPAALSLLLLASAAPASEAELRARVAVLERAAEADRRRIADLEHRLDTERASALGETVEHYLEQAGTVPGRTEGGALALAAELLVAAGASTATQRELAVLQAGGHDPRRRGFTFQQLEVGLLGEAGEHLSGEAYVVLFLDPEENETVVELEEAFGVARFEPVEVELGHFFTEFGAHNPLHPHAWAFVDAPVVSTRFFGGDGMRGPGARIAWARRGVRLHGGAQNAEGETMASFLGGEAPGGRPSIARRVRSLGDLVYLARVEAATGDAVRAAWGVSGLFGPNATGPGGTTVVYGLDLRVTARRVEVVLEAMGRRYRADAADGLPAAAFDDWGAYVQAVARVDRRWRAGVRVGIADAEAGDRRVRLSALLALRVSDRSRLRLQVNLDHLPEDDHVSVWLAWQVGFGGGGHEHD